MAAFGVLGGVPTWHIRYDNLAAARKAGSFTSEHEAFWAAARKVNGDGPALATWSRSCSCTAPCARSM